VGCVWQGPHVSDFNCQACNFGYELGADNATCVKPDDFRPYRGWGGSADQRGLTVKTLQGDTMNQTKAETDTLVILQGFTYTVAAPKRV